LLAAGGFARVGCFGQRPALVAVLDGVARIAAAAGATGAAVAVRAAAAVRAAPAVSYTCLAMSQARHLHPTVRQPAPKNRKPGLTPAQRPPHTNDCHVATSQRWRPQSGAVAAISSSSKQARHLSGVF